MRLNKGGYNLSMARKNFISSYRPPIELPELRDPGLCTSETDPRIQELAELGADIVSVRSSGLNWKKFMPDTAKMSRRVRDREGRDLPWWLHYMVELLVIGLERQSKGRESQRFKIELEKFWSTLAPCLDIVHEAYNNPSDIVYYFVFDRLWIHFDPILEELPNRPRAKNKLSRVIRFYKSEQANPDQEGDVRQWTPAELASAYNASTMPTTVVKHTAVPEHISETLARSAIEATWEEEEIGAQKVTISTDIVDKI